jgi:hypothetical protein
VLDAHLQIDVVVWGVAEYLEDNLVMYPKNDGFEDVWRMRNWFLRMRTSIGIRRGEEKHVHWNSIFLDDISNPISIRCYWAEPK